MANCCLRRFSAVSAPMPDFVAVIGRSNNIGALRRSLAPCAVEEMSPVYVQACEETATRKRGAHERGLTLAHRLVWEEAQRRSARYVLVLEKDAVASSSDTAEQIEQALLYPADVTYLGWCYGQNMSHPPLCTHAYVLSRDAVNALLDSIPTLGCVPGRALPPLDHIFRRVIEFKGLSWKKVNNPRKAPRHWTSGIFHQEGPEDPLS